MATQFTRSVRAIHASNARASLVGLLLAILLMSIWMAWFFLARISIYELSEPVTVTGDEMVVAYFPLEARGHIRQGQTARLQLGGALGFESSDIPAVIHAISSQPERERLRVDVLVRWDAAWYDPPESGLTGRVEVEAERVSPAVLFLRAAGEFVNSPQSIPNPGE